MALLLAGLPAEVPGATVNRLCGSGMDAVGIAARAIKSGETDADDRRRRREHDARAVRDGQGRRARSRARRSIEDTTIGWRFVNPLMKAQYGVDSMPETAENVAARLQGQSRADQDAFALRSQQRAAAAHRRRAASPRRSCRSASRRRRAIRSSVATDEHPRDDDARGAGQAQGRRAPGRHGHRGQRLGRQRRRVRAAARVARQRRARHGLTPRARVVATAAAGVAPRIMGIGPAPAMRKVLALAGAEARRRSTSSSSTRRSPRRRWRCCAISASPTTRAHVNPNGGAIALGHPLGASGARLVTTAMYQLQPQRRPLRAVHDVHRRRAGHRDDHRARLTAAFVPGSTSGNCTVSDSLFATDAMRDVFSRSRAHRADARFRSGARAGGGERRRHPARGRRSDRARMHGRRIRCRGASRATRARRATSRFRSSPR